MLLITIQDTRITIQDCYCTVKITAMENIILDQKLSFLSFFGVIDSKILFFKTVRIWKWFKKSVTIV